MKKSVGEVLGLLMCNGVKIHFTRLLLVVIDEVKGRAFSPIYLRCALF